MIYIILDFKVKVLFIFINWSQICLYVYVGVFHECVLHLFVSKNPDNRCDGHCHEESEGGASEIEHLENIFTLYFFVFLYFHLEHSGDEADEQHQHVEQAECDEACGEGDELRVMVHPMGGVVGRLRLCLHLLDVVHISHRRHRV